MSSSRPPYAWMVVAYVLGGTLIGALDAARMGSTGVALAIIPVAAATGLVAGGVIALSERLVANRRWKAPVLALPTLIVTIPVAPSLFAGAYAQTLPGAAVAPYVLPVVVWLLAALAIGLGRGILGGGDLTARAIVLLVLVGAFGGVIFVERRVLGAGYPDAHQAATLAIVALLGTAMRVVRKADVATWFAASLAGLVLGATTAACLYGLSIPDDRALLAARGEHARDLVHTWRGVLDLDRDGASALLGGGDCDDLDPNRYPGAIDIPGDGIDQDCDGVDAPLPPPPLPPKPAPPKAAARPDVKDRDILLVTVDALRFDLLAPGAPNREDFPHITALLDDSLWFTHAIAPASGTDVSLSTILTGRLDPYQPVAQTLPEAMHALGRHTNAAIPAEVLRFVGELLIERGFDRVTQVQTDWKVQDVGDHVSAPATTAELQKAQHPAFVWLHYFDVHEHHQIDVPKALLDRVHPGASPTAHKYRALLRAIDDEIGKLPQDAVIVFASDHGESLGEDPRLLDTHGAVAYGPLVRIPLAIHIPGVHGARRTETVSLVDLFPTLIALAGGTAKTDGYDLLGELPVDRAIAIHEEQQWSVVVWPYQLIVRPADNVSELYDLEADPGEHHPLANAELVTRLRSRFAEAPAVRVDRTPNGRAFREQQARPPPSRAP